MLTRRSIVSAAVCALAAVAAPPPKPKLVVGIVIDQFRYDYTTRFRADYTGGIARFLRDGAVFTNARYIHFPTVTAVGHSTLMSGATPSYSGIVGNEWYDRESGKQVTSVGDAATKLLGGHEGEGCSPRRLAVSTIGDEMKLAWQGKPRVIGISLKDRAAILPAGHAADGAYWFDPATGNFVSSTFYFESLPAWVKEFNDGRPADKYLGAVWTPLIPNPDFAPFAAKLPSTPGPAYYGALEGTPFGNDLLEALAERAIDAEKLGQRGLTDLLTVSFSSNDYVGHEYGPQAPQVRDISIRVDRTLEKFFEFIDKKVGLANTLFVITGDHGVPPVPEVLQQYRMPGGRLSSKQILATIEKALSERYGPGQWVVGYSGASPYLNQDLMRKRKLNEAEVEHTAAEAVLALPHIYRVYTREDVLHGAAMNDGITQRIVNGTYSNRSSDLYIIEEPYWIQASHGTTHGSPFVYDSHVVVAFMGPDIKPGRYDGTIAPNDIAPTLATMLDIETPSGSVGRVLTEMLAGQ